MKMRKVGRFIWNTIVAFGLSVAPAVAQGGHDSMDHHAAPENPAVTSAFVKSVREVTRRFQDISVATAEGYVPMFGCVTGSSEGVMGVHLVNAGLVNDPALDIAQPEILLYEPLPDGRMRLTGVDYLVLASVWDAANPAPPQLAGQLFHYFESPNRFGLPAFYTLHVWAWKDNPRGTFANWNPTVSCDAYNPGH